METKKKLSLNKETIVSLNSETMYNVQGRGEAWGECRATLNCDKPTGGCTDGCGGDDNYRTWLACTDGHCTRDCGQQGTGDELERTSGNGAQ